MTCESPPPRGADRTGRLFSTHAPAGRGRRSANGFAGLSGWQVDLDSSVVENLDDELLDHRQGIVAGARTRCGKGATAERQGEKQEHTKGESPDRSHKPSMSRRYGRRLEGALYV